MSRLDELAQKIKSLPDSEAERGRIAIVRRVNQDAKAVADGLAIVLKQAPHIDTLRDSGLVIAVRDSISNSVTHAKNLKRLICRDSFGSEKKISEYLDNLKNIQKAIELKRTNAWEKIQSEVQVVETILSIAEKLKLKSVTMLQSAANSFRKATMRPPTSKADVDSVIKARDRNKDAITDSGLTGNVKKILDGAIKANGDPRLLFEDDVKNFLKDHPELWESLKLKLA